MTSESSRLSLTHLKLLPQSESAQDHFCRIGPRLCLLQRCERSFQPHHPLDRYCSPECLAAARRWQRRFANQIYRRSTSGKLRRKEQAKRYRVLVKQREALEQLAEQGNSAPANDVQNASTDHCEGDAKDSAHEKSGCHRPGCYRRFTPPPQSPLKRFCSPRCRNALRRVLLRERRWLARLGRDSEHPRDGPGRQAS